MRLWSLVPRPCPHEAAGAPHATRTELVECVLTNGSPGFDVRPEPLSHTQRQRRWRRRVRARLMDAWGGYCGAGAPPGVGCGANSGTSLDWAHLVPTGLSGAGRGTDRITADIRAHPYAYCLLCPDCHYAFDASRSGP